MATVIEWHRGTGNWTIGEDITPGGQGLRNMANPTDNGQPSHYADLFVGGFDNGYVHFNSGIAAHWFYLLVNGGQNATLGRESGTNVTGIGIAAAADIAYAAFTALPSTANFCAARESTIAVAGAHAANVADAWDEVGVSDALCADGGGNGTDTTPPVILDVRATTRSQHSFEISWFTEEPSDTEVEFSTGLHYAETDLLNTHAVVFPSERGVTYQYRVHSTDAVGNRATSNWYAYTAPRRR
jgi:thermolysin